MTDETKRTISAWAVFIGATALVVLLVVAGQGCATPVDPRDPGVLRPAPITYPSPR